MLAEGWFTESVGDKTMPKAIVFAIGEKGADHFRAAMRDTGEPFSVTIGRAGECDIVLPSDLPFRNTVSRSHLRFYRVDNEFWVEDQGSKNFTWIEGRVSLFPCRITLPCRLRLGNVPVHITSRELDDKTFSELSSFWPAHLLVSDEGVPSPATEGLDWTAVFAEMGEAGRWSEALLEVSEILTHSTHPDEAESALTHCLEQHLDCEEIRLFFDIPPKKSVELLRHIRLGDSVHEKIRNLSLSAPAFALKNKKTRQMAWGYLTARGGKQFASLAVGQFDRKTFAAASAAEAAWLVTVALQMAIPTIRKLRDLQAYKAIRPTQIRRVPSDETIEAASELGLIGESPAFFECLYVVEVAVERFLELRTGDRSLKAIYLRGERGTGKTSFAALLHRLSSRNDKELMQIAIGDVKPNMAESELFGIKRDAMPDVKVDRPGLFGQSKNKMVFIDEVDRLRPDVQAKLLHTLSEGKYSIYGDPETHERTNAYVVVAANEDLDVLVTRKEFLPQLRERLEQFEIDIPPLRERTKDIPILIGRRLDALRELNPDWFVNDLDGGVMDAMIHYEWPGNIAELNDVIDAAAKRAADNGNDTILWRHLQSDHRAMLLDTDVAVVRLACDTALPIKENVSSVEREYLARALGECNGDIDEIARRADCSKGTIQRIEKDLKKYLKKASPQDRVRFETLAGEGWSRIDPDQTG